MVAKSFKIPAVPCTFRLFTLTETNIASENRPSQKEIIFQPLVFRGCVSFREGNKGKKSSNVPVAHCWRQARDPSLFHHLASARRNPPHQTLTDTDKKTISRTFVEKFPSFFAKKKPFLFKLQGADTTSMARYHHPPWSVHHPGGSEKGPGYFGLGAIFTFAHMPWPSNGGWTIHHHIVGTWLVYLLESSQENLPKAWDMDFLTHNISIHNI